MRFISEISMLIVLVMTFAFQSHGQTVSGQEVLQFQQVLQGIRYNHYYPAVEGHQYLSSPVYATGSLKYEGVQYYDLLLNYDTYNQLVMTAMVQDGFIVNVILDRFRIDDFELSDQYFIHVQDSAMGLVPGIYRSCFESRNLQLYALTTKNIVGNNFTGALTKKFILYNDLYLILNEQVFKIEKKKDIRLAFSDYPEIISDMKASKLRFSKATMEKDLVRFLNNYYQTTARTTD